MRRATKNSRQCLLIAFLMFSLCGIAIVRADDLIPMPIIHANREANGYSMWAWQGSSEVASVIFGIGTENGQTIWQGDIRTGDEETETLYNFQYVLGSSGNNSDICFNCLNRTIPAVFANSGYDMETTNATRDSNNVPIWTNTVNLNGISVTTFGHTSMINIVLTQHFHADWTTLTIKTDVIADLSNLKLYTNEDSEVPQGTTYSLNFDYYVDLGSLQLTNGYGLNGTVIIQTDPNSSAMNPPSNWGFVPPSQVTSNEISYSGIGQSHSIADMSLANSYTEMPSQASKTATTFFNGENGGCVCEQIFDGLTYGSTTGIQSDPTIHIQHDRPFSQSLFPTQPFPILSVAIGITIGAVVVTVVTVVVVRFIKKKKKGKVLSQTQTNLINNRFCLSCSQHARAPTRKNSKQQIARRAG